MRAAAVFLRNSPTVIYHPHISDGRRGAKLRDSPSSESHGAHFGALLDNLDFLQALRFPPPTKTMAEYSNN